MEYFLVLLYCAVTVLLFSLAVEGYEIGAPCNYDNDCIIENAFCMNQQVCDCKKNFLPTEDRQMCIAAVGAVCMTKYDCVTLEHSDCQQNVCECERGYVPDPRGNICLPRTSNIRGPCQMDIQCQASFGDNSHCLNSACVCQPQYHFIHGHCFKSKAINEVCHNSSDCYIGESFLHQVQCKAGECQCIDGYVKDIYNKCSKSAAHSHTPFIYTLGLMVGAVSYFCRFNTSV